MKRIPAIARAVALVAVLNALVWSLITPPFQAADETGHFAYIQHLAQTGKVPDKMGANPFSPELTQSLNALLFPSVVGRVGDRPIEDDAGQRAYRKAEAQDLDRSGEGGFIESSPQPPLYYGMESAVYWATSWTDLTTRLWFMRLLSVLFAGITALFCTLFVRELIPGSRIAQAVGGLAVAFQPVFAFTSGAVTPDSLFFAASAATFFFLARAFRRGLSPPLGVALGLAVGVGTISKLNYAAFLPGVAVALALLVWRAKDMRGVALRGAAAAIAVIGGLVAAVVALNVGVLGRSAWGGAANSASTAAVSAEDKGKAITPLRQLSYTWQLFLPRLPFMSDEFPYFPPYQTWFRGGVGIFGWLETVFPPWVYKLAFGFAVAVAALVVAGVVRVRAALRGHAAELLVYLVLIGGLALSIGVSGLNYRSFTGNVFEQARYLLPLLALYAIALGLATRALGTRLRPYVAVAILTLVVAEGLFGQLLMISRFYG